MTATTRTRITAPELHQLAADVLAALLAAYNTVPLTPDDAAYRAAIVREVERRRRLARDRAEVAKRAARARKDARRTPDPAERAYLLRLAQRWTDYATGR